MKSYIINRMYAGSYLEKNIGGGEAINLLHADDGVNYCFINPYGTFDPKYNDTVQAVIHTQFYEVGCFEVLGISVLDTQNPKNSQLIHTSGKNKAEKEKNAADKLREYTKSHPILYGGVPYLEEDGIYASITFKSVRLLYPKKKIFICDKEYRKEFINSIVTYKFEDARFSQQSLHMYVNDEKQPKAFEKVTQMLANEELWEEKITKIDDLRIKQPKSYFNFLTLIGKEDDELAFSNMFKYFFENYPDLLIGFARDFLKAEIGEGYTVEREHHHIDLWIEDDDDVIVIENKVKSGINGASARHDLGNEAVKSQLLEYYEYAVKYAKDKHKHPPKCFLFVPNHNHIDLSVYEKGNRYKVIRYGDIYRYLISQSVDSPYYGDFCNALYKHTKSRSEENSEKLIVYLLKQIKKKKKTTSGT